MFNSFIYEKQLSRILHCRLFPLLVDGAIFQMVLFVVHLIISFTVQIFIARFLVHAFCR